MDWKKLLESTPVSMAALAVGAALLFGAGWYVGGGKPKKTPAPATIADAAPPKAPATEPKPPDAPAPPQAAQPKTPAPAAAPAKAPATEPKPSDAPAPPQAAQPKTPAPAAAPAKAPATEPKPSDAPAPPQAAQPKTPAPAAAPAKAEDSPYTVQLGAFNDLKQAKELQAELQEKGHVSFLFQWTSADFRRWYAVRVGGFADLDAAVKAAKEFRLRDQMLALVRHNGAP
jgi:hypothetical protein